jgi:phage shock protein A
MLCQKIKVMIGTIINKVTNCMTTPLERLEYLQEKKEAKHRETLQDITEVSGNIKELEAGQAKLATSINEATLAAENAVKDGASDDAVTKIIIRRNSLKAQYTENQKYLDDTKLKLENWKAQVKELEAAISEVKLQIVQLTTAKKISGVKIKIAKTTAGLDETEYQLNQNLKLGKAEVDKENAQADAIMELKDEGVYDSLSSSNIGVDGEIEKINNEAMAKSDLAELKTKLGKIPEKKE